MLHNGEQKTPHQRVQTVLFHLYEIKKLAKLNLAIKSQNVVYTWGWLIMSCFFDGWWFYN